MEQLEDIFENKLIQLSNEFTDKGLELHEQVNILGYICLELSNKIFMDKRFGYTHFLSMLIQRIIYDVGDTSDINDTVKKLINLKKTMN